MNIASLKTNSLEFVQQHPVSDEDKFDIRKYWLTVRRGKWSVLLIIISTLIIGALIATSMTPEYRATSKILADPQTPSATAEGQTVSNALVFLFYETQYEIIGSKNVAKAVVDKLGLVNKYKDEQAQLAREEQTWLSTTIASLKEEVMAMAGKDVDASPREISDEQIRLMLAAGIQNNLEVTGGRQSKVINISYTSDDPKEAADIINATADAYISFGLETRLEEVRSTEAWLGEQFTKLREQLQDSEVALSSYRSRQGLVDTAQQQQLANTQLQNLNNELISAQTEYSAARDQFDSVKGIQPGSLASYALAPVLANATASAMVKEQADQVREVEQLEQRYGELHPRMIAARSALNSIRANLKAEITKIITNVGKSYRSAETQLRNVERLIAESRTQIQNLQGENLELVRLEREVENNRRVYESFQTQLMEANIDSEFDASNIHIIDRASVPAVPFKPNVMLILIASGVIGTIMGIFLVLFREALNNTIKVPDAIEEKINLASLGYLPTIPNAKRFGQPQNQYFDNPRSTFSECINTLRTGLVFSNIDHPPKTILVTSSTEGEGKSTLAINLAAAYSNIGKTCLLEVDLRKPSLARYLDVFPNAGLSEFVTGKVQDMNVFESHDKSGNLTVITSGEMPRNPAELLSSKKFANALEELERNFDYIIMDGPPTLPVSDSCILGSKVDAVIMAIKAEHTKINVAKEAVKRLHNHNANLVGAVLTVAEVKNMSYYGDQYAAADYYGNVDPNKLKVANV